MTRDHGIAARTGDTCATSRLGYGHPVGGTIGLPPRMRIPGLPSPVGHVTLGGMAGGWGLTLGTGCGDVRGGGLQKEGKR